MLARVDARGVGVAWAGEVKLPVPRGTAPLRLVLREYEQYPADPPGAPPARRLVYADKVDL